MLVARDGTMLKLKTSWWLALAAASKRAAHTPFLLALLRARPTLDGVPPEAVWTACLAAEADDLICHLHVT